MLADIKGPIWIFFGGPTAFHTTLTQGQCRRRNFGGACRLQLRTGKNTFLPHF